MSTRGADYTRHGVMVWVDTGDPNLKNDFASAVRSMAEGVFFEKGSPQMYPAAYKGEGHILSANFQYFAEQPLSGSDFETAMREMVTSVPLEGPMERVRALRQRRDILLETAYTEVF